MKFGRTFKEALAGKDYPQHWVESAIPYRQLKKILGSVREELIRKGYDPETIHKLLEAHEAEYHLVDHDSLLLRPTLVVRPAPTTPSISPDSLAKLLAAAKPFSPPGSHHGHASDQEDDETAPATPDSSHEDQWVMIPLDSDATFFNTLQADVGKLDSLQSQERQSMNDGIGALGSEIAEVTRPKEHRITFAKSDLYRWREIFEIYLSAEIFFSTSEVAGGSRTSESARMKLVWFQEEVNKRNLPQKFKLAPSSASYRRFMELNLTLLQNFQFQELNKTAITKIIKKFDKQTSLGVKATFPQALKSASFIADNIAKSICAQLSSEVLAIVPQVMDHTCTICSDFRYLPIRLSCGHLFCIRCAYLLQQANKRLCPLCRAPSVHELTFDNIDKALMHYLEKWFPKEVKAKQAYNELMERKDQLGPNAGGATPCVIM
ncbi:SPX domain-containing protein [Cercophora scortea]|uniref:SPX domain-containing protein n=1 Tax=Cercophora scortea TaxID=314031 RepID=A0AAE0I9B5_9PEZI|nr:SPX domain-containing protein [Cercophora scortea]